MNDYRLTVAGLGPGDAGLITRETWTQIEQAEQIVLRTRIHPSVSALDDVQIAYETYDPLYEEMGDFDALYAAIVADLCARVRTGLFSISSPEARTSRSARYSSCALRQSARGYCSTSCPG